MHSFMIIPNSIECGFALLAHIVQMRILPHWPSDTSTFSASTGDLVRDVPLQKATKFDSRKTYLPKEKGADFFDDGHEIGLLHFIYSHKNLHKMRGSPKHVVAAMDENGRKKNYLMNVGKNKGRVVTELIAEVEPKVMVRF